MLFFFPMQKITWKQSPAAIITTMIYGILYFIMVVLIGKENGGWNDHYMFNANGTWYLSFIVMQILAYLIGLGLRAVHNRFVPAGNQHT